MKKNSIYQLKISLNDSNPLIWRRIQVPAKLSLLKLHDVFQIVMGWQDSHLHRYIVNDEEYALEPDEYDVMDDEPQIKDESKFKLIDIAEKAWNFRYVYDFGDNWQHEVIIEKILPVSEEMNYPICIGGENACPPEDCGSTHGYEELIEALSDPKHEEHISLKMWVGGYFDPKSFDPNRINRDFLWMKKW